jgi:hypothetical protein
LLLGLMELGWNKALDAAEHTDKAKRARDRAELDWWVRAATPALLALCPGQTGVSLGQKW